MTFGEIGRKIQKVAVLLGIWALFHENSMIFVPFQHFYQSAQKYAIFRTVHDFFFQKVPKVKVDNI